MSDMTSVEPCGKDKDLEAFLGALDVPGERFTLFQPALLIAAHEYPGRDSAWWRKWQNKVHELTSSARDLVEAPSALTPKVALRRLCQFFCVEMDFRGAQENYAAPANSCLPDVLERRRGLPITLSVLLIAIGSRLGLDLYGVGAPGHFLVGARIPGEEEPLFIDPFHGPELLNRMEAAERAGAQLQLPAEQVLPFLVPASPRQILVRMLNNLKVAYRGTGEMEKLLRVVEWLLALEPGNLSELRNRGLLLLRLGRTQEGAGELLRYVSENPGAEDLDIIREEALRALKNKSMLN